MTGGVDAQGQAAGNGNAAAGKVAGEFPGGLFATPAGIAAAHHGDLWRIQAGKLAENEQPQRRVRQVCQGFRVAGGGQRYEMAVRRFQPLLVRIHLFPVGIPQQAAQAFAEL